MKRRVSGPIQVNAYHVVMRAVEEGAQYGVERAYKHTDTPGRADIAEAVTMAITNELCEVLIFEGHE